MALKVKAVERLLKFDKNDPGSYRYVLKPELYTVTQWLCPDSAPCDSDSVRSLWRRSRT